MGPEQEEIGHNETGDAALNATHKRQELSK